MKTKLYIEQKDISPFNVMLQNYAEDFRNAFNQTVNLNNVEYYEVRAPEMKEFITRLKGIVFMMENDLKPKIVDQS